MDKRKEMFSARLRQLMQEKQVKSFELGEKIGRTAKTMQRMCYGYTMPDLFLFMDICEMLGVSMDEFWTIEEGLVSREQ